MVLTDVHTHSAFSADGVSPLEDMVGAAFAKGVKYYGVSEHFDYDYNALGIPIKGKPAFTDADAYFKAARALQRRYGDMLLVGGEFGYSDDGGAQEKYAELIERYSPDFVVNSVHTVDGKDCWFGEYFAGKTKRQAYGAYLERVLESLSAPYPYDIVAHVGYVSRNAPYGDNKIDYSDYPDLYDRILKGVVERGKILEVNSSSRGAGSRFLPDVDVLSRYYELGGRKVSFASDAHSVDRICDGRAEVVAALGKIGFTCITVPARGGYTRVRISRTVTSPNNL